MKKLFLLMTCLFTVNISLAQAVFDYFDHYTSGEYLCPQSNNLWTTWDYNQGGLSDVYITNEHSFSGNNSIKFDSDNSTADVVLPLGNIKTNEWLISFMMRIESGYGAYFNMLHEFSGDESNWAFEAYFSETGTVHFNAANMVLWDFSYPTGEWFKVSITIDPEVNSAKLFINNIPINESTWAWCLGSGDLDSTIAAINFHSAAPEGEQALFYIDDVNFRQTDLTLEESGQSCVSIYPNPSTDKLIINFEDIYGVNCQIFSSLGELVYEKSNLSNHELIDCSECSPGLYSIKINNQLSNVQHIKFIVK